MAGPHENLEHAEHAQHAAHEGGRDNKKIALIISVLALFLAFSETFGKSAQTAALNVQIEASNLWNFFQAKNIRRTMTIVLTEIGEDRRVAATSDAIAQGRARQADRRVDQDGGALSVRAGSRRRQGRGDARAVAARAGDGKGCAISQLNKYHNFEFASAAFQIGIVLASAAVITGIVALAYAAIGVGLIGVRAHRHRACSCRSFCTTCCTGSRRCSPAAGTSLGASIPPAARRRAAAGARCGGRSGPAGRASSARTSACAPHG